jgi:hypothetical protein
VNCQLVAVGRLQDALKEQLNMSTETADIVVHRMYVSISVALEPLTLFFYRAVVCNFAIHPT